MKTYVVAVFTNEPLSAGVTQLSNQPRLVHCHNIPQRHIYGRETRTRLRALAAGEMPILTEILHVLDASFNFKIRNTICKYDVAWPVENKDSKTQIFYSPYCQNSYGKGHQVIHLLPTEKISTNRKWQDYVYIQCEYKSTKQKIKHLLREENKVKENKIS